jgi:cytidine deaminase|tara:strand:+ start:603 stop:983 length:381 start_codon:yes stop_codon:yes gene_type:complete
MNDLISKAIQMMKMSRAPYSSYSVGAAIKIDEEIIVGGCNIENASYPLSICAERTALFSAIAQGYNQFIAMAVATKNGGTPCGACRQVIWELCGDIPIYICDNDGIINETTSRALLPAPFEKHHLK